MSSITKWLSFAMGFWALICLTAIAVALGGMLGDGKLTSQSPLGIVVVQGELADATPYIEELRTLREERGVKGIVLRVESPGGPVGAAQELYTALVALRADSFPVVASFGNIAASGGYYASLPAERIFANAGSITGSIGVITQFMHGEDLMRKIGIGATTITSGKMKDAGNPFRSPRPEDVQYFQGVVDDTYEQFIEAVSVWRAKNLDSLRLVADGRVFTGRQAMRLGLLDTLGSQQEAVAWLSKRCGLDSIPTTLESALPAKPWIEEILGDVKGAFPASLRQGAKVLWMLP